MSSRVHRLLDAMDVAPILWRQAGGGAPTTTAIRGSDTSGASHRAPGAQNQEQQNQELQREIQAQVDAARQKALAEGEAAGAQRAAAKLEPAMAAFRSMTEALASQRAVRRAEAEEELVQLAIAIARRVLHRELATDSEAILGLVKAAAARLNAREVRRLRLSPTYFTVVAAHRAELDLPPGLHIEADESLGPDSVVFETTRGELDASVGTQLAEIERGLADIVRRKSR
jgi:flagellar assembly protein FliH